MINISQVASKVEMLINALGNTLKWKLHLAALAAQAARSAFVPFFPATLWRVIYSPPSPQPWPDFLSTFIWRLSVAVGADAACSREEVMAVEHSIKELKGLRASRKQPGSRRPAVPSSLFTNTSNLLRALTDGFNAAVGTTWKRLRVRSDVSVLSCEREVELLEEGQLTAFLSHSCVVLYLC